jgi:hypothetical protein
MKGVKPPRVFTCAFTYAVITALLALGFANAAAAAPFPPSFTAPGNYSWNNASSIAFAGTAEAGSTVEIIADNVTQGTTVAASNGTWSRTITGFSDGDYVFTARATNASGASGF